MEDWIRRLHKLLTDSGMEVYILNKYVDDVLSVVKSLELGTRWSKNNGLTHSVEDTE